MQYTKELFDKSISVLVKAYFDETLEHGFCTACAVGNLVAASMGTKPKRRAIPFTGMFEQLEMRKYLIGKFDFDEFENGELSLWQDVFMTNSKGQEIKKHMLSPKTIEQIERTGYKWQDLAKIEYAFEAAEKGEDAYSWMFNGLMAVVDVLCDIHGMNETEKQESKALFVKV